MGVAPGLGRVAVVGASLAGLRACEELRRLGFVGELVVVDAERHPFYDRPPLSKQFLAGAWDESRLALRRPEQLAALGMTLRLGRRAVGLDLDARRLELDDGEQIGFDGLVLAGGASARPLPGPGTALPGDGMGGRAPVLTVRTLDDARRLRAAIGGEPAIAATAQRRLVVVGAGFLGLEVAATATGLGAEVTVVEPLAAPLERVLGPRIGSAIGVLHERHGVRLLLGTGVSGIGARGGTARVALQDGSELVADAVLVAIGARPEVSWLAGSGLQIEDGVVCDPSLRAAPGVVVAGDLARVREEDGTSWRVEHWTNAAEQGVHAAVSLLAGEAAPPFRTVQYFWSDQFSVKLQAIGRPSADAEVAVVAGSLDDASFVACYGRDGVLTGVVAAGMPRRLMAYRPMLAAPTPFADAVASA
jgi:NADPH-dependent 2,4-dienoyl-CoA reductase/sulfur reductase-like enzyme